MSRSTLPTIWPMRHGRMARVSSRRPADPSPPPVVARNRIERRGLSLARRRRRAPPRAASRCRRHCRARRCRCDRHRRSAFANILDAEMIEMRRQHDVLRRQRRIGAGQDRDDVRTGDALPVLSLWIRTRVFSAKAARRALVLVGFLADRRERARAAGEQRFRRRAIEARAAADAGRLRVRLAVGVRPRRSPGRWHIRRIVLPGIRLLGLQRGERHACRWRRASAPPWPCLRAMCAPSSLGNPLGKPRKDDDDLALHVEAAVIVEPRRSSSTP